MAKKRYTAEQIIIKPREQRAGLMKWHQAPSRNRQKTRPSSRLAVGVASESRRPKIL